MTMPADIRKLAQEAVELSSGESLSWDALDCEFPGDVVITYPDGHTETFYAWEHARFIAHAGTHYATIARALIEALDERDEARRRFHARDAEADRSACDRLVEEMVRRGFELVHRADSHGHGARFMIADAASDDGLAYYDGRGATRMEAVSAAALLALRGAR